MDKLNELLAKCALKNVYFEGKLGTSNYSAQDVLHTLGLRNINEMYEKIETELSKVTKTSLFKTGGTNSAKKAELTLKSETLEAIFNYKQAEAEAAKAKEKAMEDARQKLATLKSIKTTKELEALNGMSLDAINAEIAQMENAGA